MKKILLVYYEPIPSGQTTHVFSLVSGLDRSRYCLSVVLPDTLKPSIARFRSAGVEVFPLPMRKIWWGLNSFRSLAGVIRKGGYDVVHIHSQEAGLAGRLVSWLAGARRIFYTPQTVDIRRAYIHWLYILAEVLLSRVTEKIISVNDADRSRLVNWGIRPEKIVTIPNGIDFRAYERPQNASEIRRSLGVPENSPLVMQVGRLADQKDPMAFVEGAALVLQRVPQARFVMVGNGPKQAELEASIEKKGLSEYILILGHRPDASRLMEAADIVTLTSRWEGTPYSILEAMAIKKPVISTSVNGCRELVVDKKTGFLVEAGDISGWAEKLIQLLSDPATRRQYGEEGYRRAREMYSLDSMIRQLMTIYQRSPDSMPGKAVETL